MRSTCCDCVRRSYSLPLCLVSGSICSIRNWYRSPFFLVFFSCIVSLTNEPVHNFAPIQNAVRRHSALLHTTWTDRQHIHFQIVFDELSCAHFFPFISRSHIPFFPLFSFRSITVKLENSIKWNKSIPFALFHLILVNLWFFLFNLFL